MNILLVLCGRSCQHISGCETSGIEAPEAIAERIAAWAESNN